MKDRILTLVILFLEIFIGSIIILKFLKFKIGFTLMPYVNLTLVVALFLLGIKMYKLDKFVGIFIFFSIIAAGIIHIL